jgi:hypothetical protein
MRAQVFALRTMLDVNLETNPSGEPQLVIHKIRSHDKTIATRVLER